MNNRIRTINTYKMNILDSRRFSIKWEMPIIVKDEIVPNKLVGFNYSISNKDKKCGIHFYLDDYQFERVWNYPERYINVFKQYECVLSPDFSLYLDMPLPLKIWNVYRSRLLGSYYQRNGIKVIPTISWGDKDTYQFCFEGIPNGSIVSISTIGIKQNKESYKIFKEGLDEMIRKIEPSKILVYGGKVEYDYGNIEVIYYDNEVLKRFEKIKK